MNDTTPAENPLNAYPVYFIRHNWKTKEIVPLIQTLFADLKIAVHFDNYGLQLEKYSKSGRSAIMTLQKLSVTGGIVVSAFWGIDRILIGKVDTGSFAVEEKTLTDGSPFELKTLKLKDTIAISFQDFSLPFLLAPPYGTIMHWDKGQRAVRLYYSNSRSGRKAERIIDKSFFSGWHYEVLCEEWLRLKGLLKHKLFQTGKFMKGFDIVGVTPDDACLFAQVKYHGSRADFLNFRQALQTRTGSFVAYYFDSGSNIEQFEKLPHDGVTLVSVDSVYEHFSDGDQKFLQDLLYGVSGN